MGLKVKLVSLYPKLGYNFSKRRCQGYNRLSPMYGWGLSPSSKGNSDLQPRGCEVYLYRVVSDGCRVRLGRVRGRPPPQKNICTSLRTAPNPTYPRPAAVGQTWIFYLVFGVYPRPAAVGQTRIFNLTIAGVGQTRIFYLALV